MAETRVTDLSNIGQTLGRRLATLGIVTRDQLAAVGSVRAYRRLCQVADRRLPICYNLYSLEAALLGHDWRLLDEEQKQMLQRAVGKTTT